MSGSYKHHIHKNLCEKQFNDTNVVHSQLNLQIDPYKQM